MRYFAVALALAFMTFGMTHAQDKTAPARAKAATVKGYVVDAMCAKGFVSKPNPMAKAAAHTKDCALEESCSASGYGVFSDGKWIKFDDAGSKQAKASIENSKREKGLMYEVTGRMEGETFAVASLKEISPSKEPAPKKEGKADGHKHQDKD
jgi:hypothetical protein